MSQSAITSSAAAKSRPTISILIVAYHSLPDLLKCLASIAPACTRHSYEVLLIDNGDGSSAAAAERDRGPMDEGFRILPSQGNIGFGRANNLLAAQARGKFLLLLNPDVQLMPGSIDALMEGAQRHDRASAWGGVTLTPQLEPDFGNSVHIPTLSEMASRIVGRSSAGFDPHALESDRKVEALSGSFVMIARRAFDDIGGFDERFFLYCEEVDLFYRLAKAGHEFWQIAAARAIHNSGHGEVLSPQRMLYRAAGTMEFARIHWSAPKRLAGFALLWIGALLRVAAGALIGRWRPRLKEVARGHSQMARHPNSWRFGYDPKRGLLAQLERSAPTRSSRLPNQSKRS